jgi:hypothetical protein
MNLVHKSITDCASLSRRSRTMVLVDLIGPCGLPRQIAVWLDFDTLTHLRITVSPQWRPACRGYAFWLGLHPKVIEYMPDIGTVRDERNDAHLATAAHYYRAARQ